MEIDELLSITNILLDGLNALDEGEFEASIFSAKKIVDDEVEESSNNKLYELANKEADRIITEANKGISQKEMLEENIASGKTLLEQQKFDEAYEVFNSLLSKNVFC